MTTHSDNLPPRNDQVRRFTDLWVKAQPIVASYINSCVRDFHDAEDVLQNTALAAADDFNQYDPQRPFLAWVIGIARNRVLMHYRRAKRDPHIFSDETVRNLAAAYNAIQDESDGRRAALEMCLKRLQERGRRVLEMRYQRGLRTTQIAEQVGLKENAVKGLMFRVRKALASCIEHRLEATEGAS